MTKWMLSIITMGCLVSCNTPPATTKIAFGSCGHETEPMPVLSLAASYRPDAFVFLGDNIYGDTDNMDTLRAKYNRLGSKPEYQQLAQATRILATWDDHDFGRNDAGREYPYKAASKQIFLDFFKEPANSTRRQHEGIYHSEYLQSGDKTIQVLLLDVRTFRSPQLKYDTSAQLPRKDYFYQLDYKPHTSPDSVLLGEAQWQWLQGELAQPADLRLICSGSQFGIEFNGYEAWANYPHEQQRMLQLIQQTKANGILFLTGDVHYGEISKLQQPGLYPLYDITSSGITSTWDFATPNSNRIEGPVMDNHVGLLTVVWEADPIIKMEIIDKHNNGRIEYSIKKSDISFK
jgi:alkaline phosphatase D